MPLYKLSEEKYIKSFFFCKVKTARQCWPTPLIPALTGGSLRFQGQPGIQSQFQDRELLHKKHCLDKTNETKQIKYTIKKVRTATLCFNYNAYRGNEEKYYSVTSR